MGLGVEGGFDLKDKQFYFEHSYSIYIYPEDKLLSLPNGEIFLTDRVKKSVDSIISAESVTYKEELASQVQAWDGEQRFITKHAMNLLQLPVERQIPPTGWKCDLCDKRDNLWLNLVSKSIEVEK